MLEMERTTEGSIRVRNRRQSEVVRDATEARRVAHHWGHTTLSIDKALAEMTREEGTQEERAGWQVRRPAPKATPATKRAARPAAAAKRGAEPPPEPKPEPEPEAKPAKKSPARAKRSRRGTPEVEAAAEPARTAPRAEAPAPVPEAAPAPEAKKPARRRTRKATASSAEPAAAPLAEPRTRALELARELARELRSIEDAELAFARGPWAELRESAEHVAACLSGKRSTRAARGGPAPG